MYDKNGFGERLYALRNKRWEEYKSGQKQKPVTGEKYECCKSQDSLSIRLGVERRTYGKWELGKAVPNLEQVTDLCEILDTEIEYLLGTDVFDGFKPLKIAAHYSEISNDILQNAHENGEYRDFINTFMKPEICFPLIKMVREVGWKEFISERDITEIAEPVKELIKDIHRTYRCFTPFKDYSLDSYKERIADALPYENITFSNRKKDKRLYVGNVLSNTKKEELGITGDNKKSYDAFINFIAEYSFEQLNAKTIIDMQKDALGKTFVRTFEQCYLLKEKNGAES